MNLRQYQADAIRATQQGWDHYQRQLMVVPTGGGKTIIFSKLAEQTKGRTLILAHREELVLQAIDKLYKSTGIQAGMLKGMDSNAHHGHETVVGSIQTVINRLDRWPSDHFELIVCDEAHHAVSKSWQKALTHFDAKVLGVTATPDRGDKRNLGEYFENVSYEVTLLELIRDGFLVPITVKTCPLQIDMDGVSQSKGDYDSADLDEVLRPYMSAIIDQILEHAKGRKTLVFLPLIATSKLFAMIANEKGLFAEHVSGISEDRKQVLKRFATGETNLLSNAMLLTEGYDEPSVECVVILRPTRSRSLYSQMVGRGTRLNEGKGNLLLLDFLWMHQKHNLVRPAHLISKDEEEAQLMIALSEVESQSKGGGQDLEELAETAREERENKIRRMIAERAHEESVTIDAMEFCANMGDMEAADWEPTMKWHSQGISTKQAAILKKAGVNMSTVRGKGHASKLIDVYFKYQNNRPATPKQRSYMARMGHPNSENATAKDAKEFFNSLRAAS